MAGKAKKTSGNKKYQLLVKELTRINLDLPKNKQLSYKERLQFVSNRLYPQFKETAISRIRLTPLRKTISNKLKYGTGKRKNKAASLKTYNLILKEISSINTVLPPEKKLSVQQRRQISSAVYKKFKGLPVSEIRKKLEEIRAELIKAVKKVKPKEGCDVLAIQPSSYAAIAYYDIDDYLGQILPDCVNVKVSAGGYGETNIFNTRDYDYHRSGVDKITNAINNELRKGYPYYSGIIQILPRKKSDGNPDNYYLDLVLHINELAVEVRTEPKIPKRKLSKKEQKRSKNTKKYITDRLKELQVFKSKKKRIKNSFEKEIQDAKLIQKKTVFSKEDREKFWQKTYEKEKKRLQGYLERKSIDQDTHGTILQRITEAYRQDTKGKGKKR